MATLGIYTLPDDLYYERDTHLWMRRAENQITIGLDMLGQSSMGDMAYIGFEADGKTVKRGDVLGSLEAAKMVAPILAPLSGKIILHNAALKQNARLVNASPYEEGWLLKMEPTRWEDEVKNFVSGAARVKEFLEEEIKRYKEQGWID